MGAPEPILCPECNAPVASEQIIPVTAMYAAPFFDEEGRRHVHNPNNVGVIYTCRNGHEWTPKRRCWCGWEGR